MNIKFKLAFWFTLFVAFILFGSFYVVYENYSVFRQNNFYERLNDRAHYITKAVLDTRELDDQTIKTLNAYTISISPNLRVSIYDMKGNLVESIGDNIPADDFKNRLNSKNNFFIEDQINDTQFVSFIYTQKNDKWISIAASYDKTGFKKVEFLRNLFLIILLLSTITTSVAGWWFARLSLRPMNIVVEDVQKMTAKNLNSRLSISKNNDEIDHLARTFNEMLDRLERAFEVQKDFVSNASHEFRTPLTSMKGQIQVALLKERSAEEYQKLLQSLNDDINNNIVLLNALQDLAKAKANADFPMRTFYPLPILDVLIDAQNELMKGKLNHNIDIRISENIDQQEFVYCNGDVSLLKSAFINLMDNGCKFSPDNKVTINVTADVNTICLSFTDEGVGIAPEDLPHIFEPFYRGNDTRNVNGHGIGLSLVKRIIDWHKGNITITSEVGNGTTFKLCIPSIKAA